MKSAADRVVTCCRVATRDRKSTRLNSSHLVISYAVFCLKKKNPSSMHYSRIFLPTITLSSFLFSSYCRQQSFRSFHFDLSVLFHSAILTILQPRSAFFSL